MTPLRIALPPSRVWQGFVAVVAAASVASVAAWLVATPAAQSLAARLGAIAAMVFATWAAVSLWQLGAGVLSCDGQTWTWAPASGNEAVPGAVRVAIDLGSFLLLRFEPAPASTARVVWLPIGARAVRHGWHDLRAAVHSARRGSGMSRAAGPASP